MSVNLHEGQTEVFKDLFIDKLHRYLVVNCSRGWGKSFMAALAAITAVFELLELHHKVPHKFVYVIAPTYDQVVDIYYPLINYELGMERYALKSSKDQGRFLFGKGVELRLISYESVERMRGKGAYFIVWDEVSSCKKGIKPKAAWQGVIQPCLTTRWSPKRAAMFGARSPGRALIIGTPKGYNFFAEMLNYPETNPMWNSYHYDYTKSPLLDPVEIEALKDELDPVEFASEYMASIEDSGKSIFYCFKRKTHVKSDLEDFYPPVYRDTIDNLSGEVTTELVEKGEDVHVCIDFNVSLQCTGVFALRGKQMQFLDEFKGHPDTETLAKVIATKYKDHKIFAYPDPSGRSRKTSAPVGVTDFSILESYGIICLAHSKAPPIIDSVAAVNRKLMNANGLVDMYVHPRCKGLAMSLERTKWVDNNSDTATIDKTENLEHYSDGVRYATEFLFPIKASRKRVAKGFGF
jgi:hypothetical protein